MLSLPGPAGDGVVAVHAEQDIVAVAAGDRVVPVPADDRERVQGGKAGRGNERVVAGLHVQLETLGRKDVQGHRQHVAREHDPSPVGDEAIDLGQGAADDVERVGACAPVDCVVAVGGRQEGRARAPVDQVVAGVAEDLVRALESPQDVVARATPDCFRAGSSCDEVVAVTAEQGGRFRGRERAVGLVDMYVVVAPARIDPDRS